jgi:hypothetical protein
LKPLRDCLPTEAEMECSYTAEKKYIYSWQHLQTFEKRVGILKLKYTTLLASQNGTPA